MPNYGYGTTIKKYGIGSLYTPYNTSRTKAFRIDPVGAASFEVSASQDFYISVWIKYSDLNVTQLGAQYPIIKYGDISGGLQEGWEIGIDIVNVGGYFARPYFAFRQPDKFSNDLAKIYPPADSSFTPTGNFDHYEVIRTNGVIQFKFNGIASNTVNYNGRLGYPIQELVNQGALDSSYAGIFVGSEQPFIVNGNNGAYIDELFFARGTNAVTNYAPDGSIYDGNLSTTVFLYKFDGNLLDNTTGIVSGLGNLQASTTLSATSRLLTNAKQGAANLQVTSTLTAIPAPVQHQIKQTSATLSATSSVTAQARILATATLWWKGLQGDKSVEVIPTPQYAVEVAVYSYYNNETRYEKAIVAAHDRFTGEVAWQRTLDYNGLIQPPIGAYYNNKIYVWVGNSANTQSNITIFNMDGSLAGGITPGMTTVDDIEVNSSGIYLSGQAFYPTRTSYACLRKLDLSGTFVWGQSVTTLLAGVQGLKVRMALGQNHLYWMVEDYTSGNSIVELHKFDLDGNNIWSSNLNMVDGSGGMAVDSNENIYVSGPVNTPTNNYQTVAKLSANSQTVWARRLSSTLQVELDVDAGGNLYIIDQANVHKWNSSGAYQWNRQFSTSEFQGFNSLYWYDGTIYIAGSIYRTSQLAYYSILANIPSIDGEAVITNKAHRSPLTGTWSWSNVSDTSTTTTYSTTSLTRSFISGIPYGLQGPSAGGASNFVTSTVPQQIYLNIISAFPEVMIAQSTLSANPGKLKGGVANLSCQTTLQATGQRLAILKATLQAQSTESAQAVKTARTSSQLASTTQGTFRATKAIFSQANFTSTTQLAAQVNRYKGIIARLTSQSSVTFRPYDFTKFAGQLTSQSTLVSNLTAQRYAQATLADTTAVLAATSRIGRSPIYLEVRSTLTANAVKTVQAKEQIQSQTQQTAQAIKTARITRQLTATSTFSASAVKYRPYQTDLVSTTQLTASGNIVRFGTGNFVSQTQLTATTVNSRRRGFELRLQSTTQQQTNNQVLRLASAHLSSTSIMYGTAGAVVFGYCTWQALSTELIYGRLIDIDPWTTLTIAQETRGLVITPETRITTIEQETRVNIIKDIL